MTYRRGLTLPAIVLEVLRERGGVVSHEALLREVWGPHYQDDGSNRQILRVAVNRLRIALEGTCEFVVTHKDRGYSLTYIELTSTARYSRYARTKRPSGGARAKAAQAAAPA